MAIAVDTSSVGVVRQEVAAKEYASGCAQLSGVDVLANVGSRDVARDMDVLRAALADSKLTYLGYSWGTRLGYTYAEQFPRNVRAMVLDGALDPTQNPIDDAVARYTAAQKAFEAFAAWCAAQQPCPLGNDPSAATENFQKLVRPLIDNPLPVDGVTLTYDNVVGFTYSSLYNPANWEQLRQVLLELASLRGEILRRVGLDSSPDPFTATACVDHRPVTDPAEMLLLSKRLIAVAPFMWDTGRGPNAAREICAFWPVPHTSEAHQLQVDRLRQTLVVSTTIDPATPYEDGLRLAEQLHARLLTVHGIQHTASLQGNRCVDSIVSRYLIELRLPPAGSQCTLTPKF